MNKFLKNEAGPAPSLNNRYFPKPKAFGCCSAGFTLIEVTVAILVFSIMIVLVASIFARAIELERRTVWFQRVQENATLALESMAKEIRVSDIQNQNNNCTTDLPLTTLTMNHPTACGGSACNVVYSLSGTNIQRQAVFASFINSTDVQFTNLRFCITGSGTNDDQSPKVTILTSIRSTKGFPPSRVDLQTTITSRDITTELQNP